MARTARTDTPFAQYRLRVQARRGLPKKFQWEIVQYDVKGIPTIIRSSEPQYYETMETAYEAGTPILLQYRSG